MRSWHNFVAIHNVALLVRNDGKSKRLILRHCEVSLEAVAIYNFINQ
ncbi:hypothetical protein [Helicobacter rodentium]|nr:hypothetical protein [Helicobacter rodentium]